jgi:hypothetical protein
VRDDGEAVAFGGNVDGQCDVPPRPRGTSWWSDRLIMASPWAPSLHRFWPAPDREVVRILLLIEQCRRGAFVPRQLLHSAVLPFMMPMKGIPLHCVKRLASSGGQQTGPQQIAEGGSGDATEQEINHHECAAVIDEEVASLMVRGQADEDFAVLVEKQLKEDGGEEPVRLSSKVHLVSFRSGKGELFRKMLLQDKEFKPLRKSLKEEGFPLVLQPSKTIVLVRSDQYIDTVNSPVLRSHTLKRYNVIIAESEEYLMDQVLVRIASKHRPRENKQERVEVDLGSFDTKFIAKRTFICDAPKLIMASTVAQSTTEAVRSNESSSASTNYFVHTRGGNPRRRGAWFE